MNAVFIIWASAAFGVAVLAIVSLPTWLLASMNRGALWKLRDRAFDARRTGVLPDVEAVEGFVRMVEDLILVLPNVTAAQVWWLGRHVADDSSERVIRTYELPEGSAEQAKTVFAVMHLEMSRIVVRQYLLCSWSGLLFAAPRHVRDFKVLLSREYSLECLLSAACMEPRSVPTAEELHDVWQNQQVQGRVQIVVAQKQRGHDRRGDLVAAG